MKAFEILTPGSYTTVQDGGRHGCLASGIPPSGALDNFAYIMANMLVGNPGEAAVLETTIIGPTMKALVETDLAITGADSIVVLNGKPIDNWKTLRVKPYDIINIGLARSGCRSYIAMTGGVDVPVFMGSRSCFPAAGIGRVLTKGMVVDRFDAPLLNSPRTIENPPVYGEDIVLRAMRGPQSDLFKDVDVFFRMEFIVDVDASRAGYRLNSSPIIFGSEDKEIISEVCLPGSVQVLPNGQAIVLLVEQTVGGYPKIATIISDDISKIAQVKPGNKIYFKEV